jgi:hypothetical protein
MQEAAASWSLSDYVDQHPVLTYFLLPIFLDWRAFNRRKQEITDHLQNILVSASSASA